MSLPSFRKFNYAFRPAKHAQRKMICESLQRLARLGPLSDYRYVGFGSVAFLDFSLFHQRLGISDMVSIEGDASAKQRMTFNRPYSCIKIKWGWSYHVLPTLTWSKRTIVWLDYEHQLDAPKLGDISLVTSCLPSGSVLIVTIPVDPADGGESPRERLQEITGRVGEDRLPLDLRGTDLSKWGTARVSRDIINDEIQRTLVDRNGPLPKSERVSYRQLFNFHYADGKQMLTVGGLLVNPSDDSNLGESFNGLEFVRPGKPRFLIDTPILTIRELRFLDSLLPVSSGRSHPAWIPREERDKYSRLYRHFPSYGVVEA
jgi:hypothetical protein